MKFSQAIIQNKIQSENFLTEIQSDNFSNWNSVHKLFQRNSSQAIIQNKIQSEDFLNWNSVRQFSKLKFST